MKLANPESGQTGFTCSEWSVSNIWNTADARYNFIGDFNGDGLADIGSAWGDTIYVKLSTGTGFQNEEWKINDKNGNLTDKWGNFDYLFIGDFNGDGRTDIASADAGNIYVKLSTGDGFRHENWGTSPYNWGPDVSYTWAGDFNGDGKTDIASADASTVYMYLSTGNGFKFQTWEIRDKNNALNTDWGNRDYKWLGDFNGDGLLDIAAAHLGNIYVKVSTGSGFLAQNWGPSTYKWGLAVYTWSGDFNGDGVTDIASADAAKIYLYQSKKDKFTFTTWQTNADWNSEPAWTRLGDFNGDGLLDIASADAEKFYLKIASSDTMRMRIENITTGIGGDIAINYLPSYRDAVFPDLTKINFNSYPVASSPLRGHLVRSVAISDGRGGNYSNIYNYEDNKIYHDANGNWASLGFKKYTVTGADGLKTETIHFHDHWAKAGLAEKELLFSSTNVLLQEKIYNFSVDALNGNATFFLKQNSIQELTYETGNLVYTKTTKNNNFDQFGNITSISDEAEGTATINTSFGYEYDLSNNILNKLVMKTVGVATTGVLQQQKIEYCGGHKPCEVHQYLDVSASFDSSGFAKTSENRLIKTSAFTYNENGQIKTSSVFKDGQELVTAFDYDAGYRAFVVKLTNPKGHVFGKTYNSKYGQIKNETDPNGNYKEYDYDQFGRLKEVRERINNQMEWMQRLRYLDFGDANKQRIETTSREVLTSGGEKISVSYFDGLERTYREESNAFYDTENKVQLKLVKEKIFDAKGRLSQESNPYLSPRDSAIYTTYFYDNASRISKVIAPGESKAISIETAFSRTFARDVQNGIFTTTLRSETKPSNHAEAATRFKESVLDSRGRVIQVNEPEGATVKYQYNELGQLVKVIDADGNNTEIKFDSLQRKIALKEPNSGWWKYRYNELGQLVSQKDPRGNIITFDYDELGRMIKKILPDYPNPVSFEYDDSSKPNGIGQLAKITDSVGTIEYAGFTERGAVKGWTREIGGIRFSFKAEYDLQSRLTKLVYPDATVVSNTYAQSGYLNQVWYRESNQAIGAPVVSYAGPMPADNGDANLLKLIRKTGNRVKTEITFNKRIMVPKSVWTILADSKELEEGATPPDAKIYEDITYEYDSFENITRITDAYKSSELNKNQTFEYDALNRLVEAKSGLYGDLSYRYTPGGNLTQKGNLTFKYEHNAHPQAVSSAAGKSFSGVYHYDANGNMVTREGRDLAYDSEDRLIQIKDGGAVKSSYKYDYRGNRVMKTRDDGYTTINVDGLYEVLVKKENGQLTIERHTKYIHGIEQEKVAQITRVDMTMAKVHTASSTIIASAIGTDTWQGKFITASLSAANFTSNSQNVLYILLALFAILAVLLITLYCVPIFSNQSELSSFNKSHPVLSPLSILIILSVLFQFGFSGCSMLEDRPHDPYSGPVVIPDDVPDINTLSGTYNDTTRNGFPYEGVYFYHPDHLGSASLITNTDGAVVSRAYYKPYGEVIRTNNGSPQASHGPDIWRYKYTEQEEDPESGLFNYGARFYDAKIGRFTQADSILYPGGSTQENNGYMYVSGNPLKFNDPTGMWKVDLFFIKMAGGKDAHGGFSMTVGIPHIIETNISYSNRYGLNIGASILSGLGDVNLNIGWDKGVYINADVSALWGGASVYGSLYLTSQEISIGLNSDILWGLPLLGLNVGWHRQTGGFVDAYATPFLGVYADTEGSYQVNTLGYLWNGGEGFGERNGWMWDQVYGNYVGLSRNGGIDGDLPSIDDVDDIARVHDKGMPKGGWYKTINRANYRAGSRADRYLRDERRGFNPRQRTVLRKLKIFKSASIILFPFWFWDDKSYYNKKINE